jgi:NhaP-type Na+/H+ or K+/H+ antiporter
VLLKSLLIGFLWGTLISVLNHYYLQRVLKKSKDQPPDRGMLAVVNCYIVRYFINIGALFLVYRDMWMLVGTAVGLMVMKNISLIQQYRESRQQAWKPKTKENRKK